MMASRILSRFLPNTESAHLDYHDEVPELGDNIHLRDTDDQELDELLAEAEQEELEAGTGPRNSRRKRDTNGKNPNVEDDVPHSLLMETRPPRPHVTTHQPRRERTAASRTEEQWRRAQDGQPLYADNANKAPGRVRGEGATNKHAVDAKEQAMWLWTNVQNLDAFLLEIYAYYSDHGIWSILLSRVIRLLTAAFLFSLYMFLSSCIDYSKIPTGKATHDVLVPKCMQKTSFTNSLLLWVFTFTWAWMLFTCVMDIRRLWSIHEFYHHLLGIPDIDLQTVSWERVVESLMTLRNANAQTADNLPRFVKDVSGHQSKQRMDAHDIANRLMRRENYFVALFNKEVFDLSLPVPLLGNRQFYSKSLEFCIQFCFNGFIFDDQGRVNPSCLERRDRNQLIQVLRHRFRLTAIISLCVAPFNIGFHCIYYFSRYYAEFRNSPGKISARAYTPLAEWNFREFNELPHNFRLRMRMSYSTADEYLSQFPRDKTIQFLKFVSLVSGTLAGLLGLATLLDPELFLGFEITPGRTAVFYLSIFTAIFVGARGSIPEDSEVHEPVPALMNLMQLTHYRPTRGKNQLHSNDVRVEFSSLYQMKVLIFLEEILSLIVAPFVLWNNSGKRSEMIIDFFRDSTVQVDGLGHLCTFSVFDFRKTNHVDDDGMRDVEGLREEYFGTKNDKMAESQFYFMQRLGNYDQKHGAMRHRPHYGLRLPPAFPPMSPMRQAAGQKQGRETVSSPPTRGRMSSPARSVLLDINHHRQPSNTTTRRSKKNPPSAHGIDQRRVKGDYFNPDEGDEDDINRLDALTTSRLIEEDNNLSDSWKDTPREPGASSTPKASETRPANGVLNMIVEYSKAHAGGKGPKIG